MVLGEPDLLPDLLLVALHMDGSVWMSQEVFFTHGRLFAGLVSAAVIKKKITHDNNRRCLFFLLV